MLKLHRPALLVLLETKMAEHKHLATTLGYDVQVQSVIGLIGGISLMWHLDRL